jgi:hypothetical protein
MANLTTYRTQHILVPSTFISSRYSQYLLHHLSKSRCGLIVWYQRASVRVQHTASVRSTRVAYASPNGYTSPPRVIVAVIDTIAGLGRVDRSEWLFVRNVYTCPSYECLTSDYRQSGRLFYLLSHPPDNPIISIESKFSFYPIVPKTA